MRFEDRTDAGRRLAAVLRAFRESRPLVIGLPRGGVVVAAEVARALEAPLDLWVVRKVGAPGQPELGIGAVAEDGSVVLDLGLASRVGASPEELDARVRRELATVRERVAALRRGQPAPAVAGRVVIVVDDGIATGGTVRAALRSLRRLGPAKLVLAVPVAGPDTLAALRPEADEVVCVQPVLDLGAVGEAYRDFTQTSDAEVVALLDEARGRHQRQRGTAVHEEVGIPVDGVTLPATLELPPEPRGLVVFAHGSGSSRRSARNLFVAERLRRRGLGTLLMDLLSPQEEEEDAQTGLLRFDIILLAHRLVGATEWLMKEPRTRWLPIGYFGASTGAAAALVAASERPEWIRSVVSRGGRPDLAGDALPLVRAPTLLVVGGADTHVLDLNEQAYTRILVERQLVIIPGATHLFEEAGALEQVAEVAGEWFGRTLAREVTPPGARTPAVEAEARPHHPR